MSRPPDDLLSAFHDGEVTPAERVVVEQRLTGSTDARRELSEIKQVSSLLKEMPRDRLPFEFPQQVLQAIEREMLIPAQQPVDPTEASAPRGIAVSRRWIGAAAVLTSAAGLLLLARALDDPPGRSDPQGQHLAGSPSLSAPTEGASHSPLAIGDSIALGRKGDAADGAAGQNFVAADSSVNTFSRARFAGAGGEKFSFDQSALGTAEVGEVVRAVQEVEGNEVAVIYLTVVDRQQGIDGLQLLLTKNRIEPEREVESVQKSDRPASAAADADQMQAVLVRSNAAQLETALKQLRLEKFLRRLEVDQPILLAQLEEARVGLADQAPADVGKRPESKSLLESSSAARRAKSAQSGAVEKQPAAPAAKQTPAGPADKSAESRGQKELFAKQVPMDIPTQVLQQNQLAQQNRSRSLAKAGSRSQTGSPNKDTAANQPSESSAAQRPVQVLFVVVDQAQAAKQQLSPVNSSKPASAPAKVRSQPAKPGEQDGAA